MVCSGRCLSFREVAYLGSVMMENSGKSCSQTGACTSYSLNLGVSKTTFNSICCDSDLCNSGPVPVVDLQPNGKQCYFCVGNNCLGNVHCEGIEDHCISYTDVINGRNVTLKGCASKNFCDTSSSRLRLSSMNITSREVSVKCCKGNLCNGAESVTLSFFLMLFFLLSCFLLH
ncbi:urokinase plasminogen activator surface receptor isoform X2 [Pangasianodon hypophthalmus]|nr:urokinase plasminogen activator surface receptor isoform X2 [Pangasianodon hypophthalmus]